MRARDPHVTCNYCLLNVTTIPISIHQNDTIRKPTQDIFIHLHIITHHPHPPSTYHSFLFNFPIEWKIFHFKVLPPSTLRFFAATAVNPAQLCGQDDHFSSSLPAS